MKIEFKIFQIKEDSRIWENIKKFNDNNEFIVFGEEMVGKLDTYKAQQLDKGKGLCLLADFKLDEFAFNVTKTELIPTNISVEFNIPKKRLTLSMIEKMQKLNVIN